VRANHDFRPSHTPFDLARYDSPYERARTKILEEFIASGDGKSALDIGCGPGYFSKVLTTKGWRTTAIDTDRENIEKVSAFVAEAHLGDATSVLSKLRENQYGLVLALEIIEHMPKNHGENFLKSILSVLKPNGKLIVSTPNRLSPEGVGGYYWGEKIRGWGKWDAWDSTHVHIYTSCGILSLLKRIGFAVDRITGFYYEGRLPVIGNWRLPLVKSRVFPFNRVGFNIMIECHRRLGD